MVILFNSSAAEGREKETKNVKGENKATVLAARMKKL